MRYIEETKLFGKVVSEVKVIEFQKRGLAHAHVLFFLYTASKKRLANTAEIDGIVRVEITGSSDPVLQHRVIKHIVHTPCNVVGNAQCQKEGRCMLFCKETSAQEL